MGELDDQPTVGEFSGAVDYLACGAAPGSDSIPPDVIMCGKPSLVKRLYKLLCREGSMPQDMRDANIVTLYKNKGDHSYCNNYRGMSLLSWANLCPCCTQQTLQLATRVNPESQCGFRAGRSTIDMLFSQRQLQAKCGEGETIIHLFCRSDKGI